MFGVNFLTVLTASQLVAWRTQLRWPSSAILSAAAAAHLAPIGLDRRAGRRPGRPSASIGASVADADGVGTGHAPASSATWPSADVALTESQPVHGTLAGGGTMPEAGNGHVDPTTPDDTIQPASNTTDPGRLGRYQRSASRADQRRPCIVGRNAGAID